MTGRASLKVLDAAIDARVEDVRRERPHWPCGRGCDGCCRNLFEPMNLTQAEWDRLELGIASLDTAVRASVEARIPEARRVCPFLELERGECLVYEYRPVACRTYGYYVHRGAGMWCKDVQRFVEEEGADGVVLGNQSVVDRELGADRISMSRWSERRRRGQPNSSPSSM